MKPRRPSSFSIITLAELGSTTDADPQPVARASEEEHYLTRVRVSVFGAGGKFACFGLTQNVLQAAGLDTLASVQSVFKVAAGDQEVFYLTHHQILYAIGDASGLTVNVHVTDVLDIGDG